MCAPAHTRAHTHTHTHTHPDHAHTHNLPLHTHTTCPCTHTHTHIHTHTQGHTYTHPAPAHTHTHTRVMSGTCRYKLMYKMRRMEVRWGVRVFASAHACASTVLRSIVHISMTGFSEPFLTEVAMNNCHHKL